MHTQIQSSHRFYMVGMIIDEKVTKLSVAGQKMGFLLWYCSCLKLHYELFQATVVSSCIFFSNRFTSLFRGLSLNSLPQNLD